mmetsp:Transcript_22668/g.41009  ORF Transcript_22668/g.41009 Transcript_22668/m.41009 type:complete len:365 (+) Transcript_22668:49-1143(+)
MASTFALRPPPVDGFVKVGSENPALVLRNNNLARPPLSRGRAPSADGRADSKRPSSEGKSIVTIQELVKTAKVNGDKIRCLDCNAVIEQHAMGSGEMIWGCSSCWASKEFKGRPPCNAAPYRNMMIAPPKVIARRPSQAAKRPSMPAAIALDAQAAKEVEPDILALKLKEIKSKAPLEKALDTIVRVLRSEGLCEWDMFQRIDADGSGELSRVELRSALRRMGCEISATELDAVLRVFDKDGSGSIDFMEFYTVIKEHEDSLPEVVENRGKKVDTSLMGFEIGARVKSTVQIWAKDSADRRYETPGPEVGTVIGAGVRGTVKVKFDRGDQIYDMKPEQIVLQGAKTVLRRSGLSAANLIKRGTV